MQIARFIQILAIAAVILPSVYSDEGKRPNVVVVITDDQGYGDVAFTGNPAIKTPTIDKLCKQGTLLNNFHVDPTCALTRSALMSGRYSDRVGAIHYGMGDIWPKSDGLGTRPGQIASLD